jgi:DNA-binding transcriptional LysR family regulator
VGGDEIALCPEFVVRADLAAGRLQPVLCDTRGQMLAIHAVHPGQRRIARRTRDLLDFLTRDRIEGFPDQASDVSPDAD